MKVSMARKILAVIVFWLLVFFGGSIVMVWNALTPSLAQYRPGDLGYLILQTISTAAGAGLAIWAANTITDGKCQVLYLVNCVIAATILSVLTGLNLMIGGLPLRSFISMGAAILLLSGFAFAFSKNVITKQEAADHFTDIKKKYEESLPVMELFEEFSKQAGMSVPGYTRYLRIRVKMERDGLSEEDAARAVDMEEKQRTFES